MALPPGQRRAPWFPRFGAGLDQPPPSVPADPSLTIRADGLAPLSISIWELAALPHREIVADLHCVAGWSAIGLRWEGVPFRDFYQKLVEPALPPQARPAYVVFEGLDTFRSIVLLEDALLDDVLLAETLNGQPLTPEHGAPLRLVSPQQYGFVSTKHLCAIELHAVEPAGVYHRGRKEQRALRMVRPHRRARVWREERHRYVPGRLLRGIYALAIPSRLRKTLVDEVGDTAGEAGKTTSAG
jgi:DMSO/TMAO reductase YedYZ molybdopterin-dependent catalytic subunit